MKKSFFFAFFSIVFVTAAILAESDEFIRDREEMVQGQIAGRGIRDERVLRALRKIRRELFVPVNLKNMAYEDSALPIGFGQTISQPYVVAYMTEACDITASDRVLEIGTGSGYQAAVIAEIASEVYSMELIKPLADSARSRLRSLGYRNVRIKHGDGYKGWKEYAPFDAIIVTAAPAEIPEELISQLKTGGRMVIPVGSFFQELYRVTKLSEGIKKEALLPVAFVPMRRPK